MIVSIGRHEKGQENLRGIIKNMSLLLPNMFTTKHARTDNPSIVGFACILLGTHSELSLPYF